MANFSFATQSSIGIDIGTRYIRALQLQRVGGAWRVLAAASVPRVQQQPIVSQEELARFVGVLDRQGFIGRQVVLAVPDQMLISGVLELPPRQSGAPLDTIAQMELARMHKRQPDSFKMAIWDMPDSARSTGATQVMAAGCDHKDAHQLLDLCEAVGLEVLALDTAAWSLVRACRPLFKSDSEVGAILDLGWTSARLMVLYDGVIIYERIVAEGGLGSLHGSLIDRTGLDPKIVSHLIEETGITGTRDTDLPNSPELAATIESYLELLVQLIQESFSYASHRYRDAAGKRLLVVGGGSAIGGLCRGIKEAVGFEVSTTTLSQLAYCPSGLAGEGRAADLIMALGLSQHGQGVAA